MTRLLKTRWHVLLLAILLSQYGAVCVLAFVGHHHEPDAQFHVSCPVCYWEIQSQENFSVQSAVLAALLDPLKFFSEVKITFRSHFNPQDFTHSYPTRAPPIQV